MHAVNTREKSATEIGVVIRVPVQERAWQLRLHIVRALPFVIRIFTATLKLERAFSPIVTVARAQNAQRITNA